MPDEKEVCYKWNEIEKSIGENNLALFLRERALKHSNYYHYGSVEKISAILEHKTLRINPSINFNDVNDRYEGIFSFCFSTGTSENLPLWFLYSGIEGKGARIGLNQNQFNQFIDNATFTLMVNKEARFRIPKEKVVVSDILYIQKKQTETRVKYNARTLNLHDNEADVVQIFQENNPAATKGLIWHYEKETRIMVDLSEYLTENKIEGKDCFIEVAIPEKTYSCLKVRFAPELERESEELIEVFSKSGFVKFFKEKVEFSEYSGTIKMGLKEYMCKNCKDKKAETSDDDKN